MPNLKMKEYKSFWGFVKVPSRIGKVKADTLAYIAWRGGAHKDCFTAAFRKWFEAQAKKHPDIFKVHVFDVYPVDEYQYYGGYKARCDDASGPLDCIMDTVKPRSV